MMIKKPMNNEVRKHFFFCFLNFYSSGKRLMISRKIAEKYDD